MSLEEHRELMTQLLGQENWQLLCLEDRGSWYSKTGSNSDFYFCLIKRYGLNLFLELMTNNIIIIIKFFYMWLCKVSFPNLLKQLNIRTCSGSVFQSVCFVSSQRTHSQFTLLVVALLWQVAETHPEVHLVVLLSPFWTMKWSASNKTY